MDLLVILRDCAEIHLPPAVHARQKKQERFNFSSFLEKRAYHTYPTHWFRCIRATPKASI